MRFVLVVVLIVAIEGRPIFTESDNEILQQTISLYSSGQPLKVEQAIAFSLRNRFIANREEFGGRNIRELCLQFWENTRPEEMPPIPDEEFVERSAWLRKLWNGEMYDFTKGALYFVFPDEHNELTEGMEKTAKIRKIEFFKD